MCGRPQLGLMLFNDAASTLHAVYLVYAASINIPTHQLLVGAVVNRWMAGIASLMWLGVSRLISPKTSMMVST